MTTFSSTPAPVGVVIRAPKTAELIATSLRGKIVRGELRPGDILPPEGELLLQFGVSRPTLREAFRILETESLIGVRRGSRGGAQVRTPDIAVATRAVGLLLQIQGTTIDDVYQARMISEPVCARLLAERRTEQDLQDLADVLSTLSAEVRSRETFYPDPDVWADQTYRFHELIVQRSGNRTLSLQGAVLQEIVASHVRSRVQRYSSDDRPEVFERALLSYARLIELVEAGQAERAEEHWRAHMLAAGRYLLNDGQRNQPVVDLFN
ncbi:FCD domain-containing protein [Nocardioides sp. cx-169]|uniref:FadR/GntR family transcriptional regulator n=1 Tax=Nocardioides sp. cx-169 TaxID=2899080 RepID=UPI001E461F87|nr:GntR family transcriptional regulator [Nocardioides sp. cx-169]MCD4533011.1 FCD domain-containing protein [Nocardioides sp. cx-169]